MFKNLNIKAKIILTTIFGLTLLSAILGFVSVEKAKESLMAKSYDTLTSARDNKSLQINNFFAQRISDINVLTNGADVEELAYDLGNVFDDLDGEVEEPFEVNTVIVKEATAPHEKFFQNYMKEYGYYDVFLITAETGHVLYTAAKESDYGTNLKFGSLKNSGLAEVWKKTLENKRPTFTDMKPYAPSNNEPAMFLGAPVIEEGEVKAVLVFQISDKSINKIMQLRQGYGKSQEDYLVGSDYLMRSDSFLDPKNHGLKASFKNNKAGQSKSKASINALLGKSNTEIVTNHSGKTVLSAYNSIKIGEDFTWAILSEISEDEVLEIPNALRIQIIIIAIVLLVIISIITYIIINKGIITPLNNFQDGLLNFFKYINRETSEVTSLDDTSNDEIGKMAKIVNENINKTKEAIEEDKKVINDTILVLAEFEKGDLGQRVNSNTSNPALKELTSLLNKMGSNLENNIENILNVLEEFSKYNYHSKVETNGIKEHLLKLAIGINSLSDATTQMLIENKSNGLTLDKSSDILLENVDILNKNSNESAAALEETAAALEEVTSNISHNTQNIVEMATYAKELSTSAHEGEELANQTTKSMTQIDDQVISINEAISVIDQIAFQTNILSLNAAVEAATAGEAGKGFAVVAQEVRNLASRSADAAREIKELVENATTKANEGKQIAQKMIKGYTGLNENITKTLNLISDVETASNEQKAGIEQINDAINSLDQQTQENASISNKTHEVAVQTDTIAKLVVQTADEKNFPGKENVKAKEFKEDRNYNTKPPQKEKELKVTSPTKTITSKSMTKEIPTVIPKPITSNNDSDEWESF
jgi:methyl-accepting chemotaxis protein